MKCTFCSRMRVVVLSMCLGLVAGTANAVPTLQLGITDGVYDLSSQTVISTSPSFSLYAFLMPDNNNLITDTYYLSMALTPQVFGPANLGSFTYNGNTVNATSDMTYGTPPIDAFSSTHDYGDLAKHGVFPTYFKEIEFSFSSGDQSAVFDVQGNPGLGPQPGTGMYFNLFDMDTSNLAGGYAIHFDLYNTKLCLNGIKGPCASNTDTDVTQYAPFSHDAQSMTVIPEPETYAMLLAGLGLIGFTARRRKQNT